MLRRRDETSDAVYRAALRRRVCSVCLDGGDDGHCGLATGVACPLDEHLSALVAAIAETRAHHHAGYARVVEARVCRQCAHRDSLGLCALRQDGRCALWLYLPLVVEAIAEAESDLR